METTTDTFIHSTSQDQLDDLVLDLLPLQGQWDEEQYLWLTDYTNRLIEFTDAEHRIFGRGSTATSVLLPGFEIAVDSVFDVD